MIFTYLIPKVYFLCQDSVFVCFDTGRSYLYMEIMLKIKKEFILYLDFFVTQMALAYRLDAISQGQKSLNFQGPTPSQLPL